jgi:ferredoxin-NADP reductase
MYKLKLLSKELVADGTMAFHFEKPAGFEYRAGQYGDFTLINPPQTDSEGDKRTFSLASAPYEPDLKIVTRLRDTAFKRVLKELPIGSEVAFEGPFGSLALPKDDTKTAVFLTGGIGATLVRSMVSQATHDGSPHKIMFFYSNHTAQSAVFMEEFRQLAAQNPNFTFVPTMTDDPAWDGEHDPIHIDMLKKHLQDITAPTYFLSGPGAMVGSMRNMLLEAGVDRTSIRSDQFVGYTEATS